MIAGKRRTIGVFMSKAYQAFDSTVYRHLEQEAAKHDLDIIVFTTVGYYGSQNEYDSRELSMFSFAPAEALDGILIAPDTYEIEGFRDKLFDMIRKRARCPVVAIRHRSDEFDCVFTDEDNAILPVIRHLAEHHGLKRISFLAGYPGHPDSDKRLQAYLEEMEKLGLPVDRERMVWHGNMWINCGEEAYQALCADEANRPEAIVCANDYMASGLMAALRERGIRVPEDIIVTGFDNVDIPLELPTLTTVEQDFGAMTVRGVEELVRQMEEGKRGAEEAPRKIRIPGKTVLGESCGCGKRDDAFYQRFSISRNRQLNAMSTREVSMTYLTIELSACDDLKELHRVLVQKLDDLPLMRDYYLCLFEKGKDENGEPVFAEDMTDQVCLVHAVRNQQDHGMPMISFDRKSLLPEMAERRDEAQVFYLMLLHQKQEFYGYAMFHYNPGQIPSTFFQHWNVLLSGALSNMHKQNELRALYEERRLSSITDVMTRLLNRRGLEERLAPIWQRLCSRQESVAFVCFDTDGLKYINDRFGHQAGDYAIRLTASAMRLAEPKDAVVARMGGDEFLAVLPEANETAANRFMDEFDRKLEELNLQENRAFRVEVSSGAVVRRLDALSTIEELIRESDEAMYRIKEEHHARRRD